jgi:tetratricopeptide (TPR) repeat protein
MSESPIDYLPEQEALEEIVETVMQAEKGEAPFALVLGSGFSRGLVPTARELVTESLPLWMKCRNEKQDFESQTQVPSERAAIARAFWKDFVDSNKGRGLDLKLDAATGLPEDNGEAYRAAFSPRYRKAVGAPAEARKFQRALMQLNKPRLNAAHFLLASLLGVQPGKTRESSLFKADAAFSRLILTTNFDPFLQTALQAVNRLYFMSDTPELGVSDEIFDDQTDAIHLVYLHGSIHRRSQAATDDEIKKLKQKNARTLAPVLKRHGVIVLGYSGWDDAIVAALAACENFDYRLYWCGLESDPLARGAFGEGVKDILHKQAAVYVQSAGAGNFMAQLCRGLVKGNPRLIDNPVAQLRELLDIIDLKELEELKPSSAAGVNTPQPIQSGSAAAPNTPQTIQSGSAATAFVQAKRSTIERLKLAEQIFLREITGPAVAEIKPESMAVPEPHLAGKVQQLSSSAELAFSLGNYEEVLKLTDEAFSLANLETAERVRLLMLRALAHYFSGSMEEALADWTEVIEWPDAPVDQVAEALYNRGVTWGKQGDTNKELADYTRVIEQLPNAPVEQIAQTLYNRGVRRGEMGDTENELADYTQLINLPDAPADQLAQALYNRGITWGQRGDREKELADYTRLIEQLEDAPVEQVAKALNNRGVTLSEQGSREQALADYTRVIEQLPDAPVGQVAQALNNRGVVYGQMGQTEKELADYTRVIEQLADAPVEQIAEALYNRGVTWGQLGEAEKELLDYTRLIEQLKDAPVEQLAKVLNNRGVVYGQMDQPEKALADYTRVIEQLPNAPVRQVAKALNNRGIILAEQGESEKALADYTRLIEQLQDAPVEDVAQVLNNRALLWDKQGDKAKALADYSKVLELPDAPIDLVAKALAGRGWTHYEQNHFPEFLADTEAALAKEPAMDFARFNLGLALLTAGRDADALTAYRAAAESFPESIENYGLADLRAASGKWLTPERAQPAIQLLESLKKETPV